MCARRSYDLTASCKASPSYQGRAAETAFSIVGFLIERLEVLLCSLHEHFREVTQGALITPGWNWQVPAARGEDRLGDLTTRTTPPVKSLIKHPHFSSVLLRLRGGGLHKTPQNRVLPFHPLHASGSPGSLQWDQLTNVCREHRLKQPRPRARADASRETFQGGSSCISC